MSAWNFERRRVVCGKFVVGVSLVTKGKANVETSLEAVRNRMRLPPEDALFAARRLDEEQLIAFNPGGAVTSTRAGIDRAEEIVRVATSRFGDFEDVTRCLRAGGVELAMLKIALVANGGALACGGPADELSVEHRLALVGDEVAIERKTSEGAFEPLARLE